MSVLATVANMREFPGAIAYSPTTGEEYSATAGDYFMRGEHDPLLDADGEPMILVRHVSAFVDVDE